MTVPVPPRDPDLVVGARYRLTIGGETYERTVTKVEYEGELFGGFGPPKQSAVHFDQPLPGPDGLPIDRIERIT